MGDYALLESCTNFTMARKRDKIKRITDNHRTLPPQLNRLRAAAQERSIALRFLLRNFDKHKANTTFYDWQTKIIHWRIEWHFVNADNRKYIDERCNEHETISQLMHKYFNPTDGSTELDFYRSRGLGDVRFLLKAEGIRCSRNRYYDLDLSSTLADNLRGRTIIEFPVIIVIYDTDCGGFDIIDSGKPHTFTASANGSDDKFAIEFLNFSDDEDVEEETRKHKMLYFGQQPNASQTSTEVKKEDVPASSTVDMDTSDNEPSTAPVNYLFSNDVDSDEMIDGDE